MSWPFRTQKLLSFVVSLVLFFNQGLWAYQYETSFWNERKLASLPLPQTPPLLNKPIQATSPAPSFQASEYSEFIKAIPVSKAVIRNVQNPNSKKTNPVVIHIQDIHMNAEAQKNISDTIRALVGNTKIDGIGLEGVFASVDLASLYRFQDQGVVQEAANYLLQRNRISGAVHGVLSSPAQSPLLFGVDNKEFYDANVAAYLNSRTLVKPVTRQIEKFQKELNHDKKSVFNPSLYAFDQKLQQYRANEIGYADYLNILRQHVETTSEQMDIYLEASVLEASLDMALVEKQRAQLIRILVSRLGKRGNKKLVLLSEQFKQGTVGYSEFYKQFQFLVSRSGLNMDDAPALKNYIRYVLLSEEIQPKKLLGESHQFEVKAYSQLARTEKEKFQIDKGNFLSLARQLVRFELGAHDWKVYENLKTRPGLITWMEKSKLTRLGIFEEFYVQARKRDREMTKNLLASLKAGKMKTAILVSGGFHEEGINQSLLNQGISVITLSPRVTKIDSSDEVSYLSVFAQEKTALEKIFEGEKLFITQNPLAGILLMKFLTVVGYVKKFPQASVNIIFNQVAPRLSQFVQISLKELKLDLSYQLQFFNLRNNQRGTVSVDYNQHGKIQDVMARAKKSILSNSQPLAFVSFLIAAAIAIIQYQAYPIQSQWVLTVLGFAFFGMVATNSDNPQNEEVSIGRRLKIELDVEQFPDLNIKEIQTKGSSVHLINKKKQSLETKFIERGEEAYLILGNRVYKWNSPDPFPGAVKIKLSDLIFNSDPMHLMGNIQLLNFVGLNYEEALGRQEQRAENTISDEGQFEIYLHDHLEDPLSPMVEERIRAPTKRLIPNPLDESELMLARNFFSGSPDIPQIRTAYHIFVRLHHVSLLFQSRVSDNNPIEQVLSDQLLATQQLEKIGSFVYQTKQFEDVYQRALKSVSLLTVRDTPDIQKASGVELTPREVKKLEQRKTSRPFRVTLSERRGENYERLQEIARHAMVEGNTKPFIIVNIKKYTDYSHLAYVEFLKNLSRQYNGNITFLVSLQPAAVNLPDQTESYTPFNHNLPGTYLSRRRVIDIFGEEFFLKNKLAVVLDGHDRMRTANAGVGVEHWSKALTPKGISFLESNILAATAMWFMLPNLGDGIQLSLSSAGKMHFGETTLGQNLISKLPSDFQIGVAGQSVELMTEKQLDELRSLTIEHGRGGLWLEHLDPESEDFSPSRWRAIKANILQQSLTDNAIFFTDQNGEILKIMNRGSKPHELVEVLLEEQVSRKVIPNSFLVMEKSDLSLSLVKAFNQMPSTVPPNVVMAQEPISVFSAVGLAFLKKIRNGFNIRKYVKKMHAVSLGDGNVVDVSDLESHSDMWEAPISGANDIVEESVQISSKVHIRYNGDEKKLNRNLRNLAIWGTRGSTLEIGEGVVLEDLHLVIRGNVVLGKNVQIRGGTLEVDGDLTIGRNTRIRNAHLKFNRQKKSNVGMEIGENVRVEGGSFSHMMSDQEAERKLIVPDQSKIIDSNIRGPVDFKGEGGVVLGVDFYPGRVRTAYNGEPIEKLVVYGDETTTQFDSQDGNSYVARMINSVGFRSKITASLVGLEEGFQSEKWNRIKGYFGVTQEELQEIIGMPLSESFNETRWKEYVQMVFSDEISDRDLFKIRNQTKNHFQKNSLSESHKVEYVRELINAIPSSRLTQSESMTFTRDLHDLVRAIDRNKGEAEILRHIKNAYRNRYQHQISLVLTGMNLKGESFDQFVRQEMTLGESLFRVMTHMHPEVLGVPGAEWHDVTLHGQIEKEARSLWNVEGAQRNEPDSTARERFLRARKIVLDRGGKDLMFGELPIYNNRSNADIKGTLDSVRMTRRMLSARNPDVEPEELFQAGPEFSSEQMDRVREAFGFILAGGKNSRFFPVIKFLIDVNNKGFTLLQLMFQRAVKYFPEGIFGNFIQADKMFVVSVSEFAERIKSHLQFPDKVNPKEVIVQPTRRGTLGAYLRMIAQRDPDDVVFMLNSDQHISDNEQNTKFRETMTRAILQVEESNEETIVLVGLDPGPETPLEEWGRWGVIEAEEESQSNLSPIYNVKKFTEKPDTTEAAKIKKGSGKAYFSSGIIVARVSTMEKLVEAYHPEFYIPYRMMREAFREGNKDKIDEMFRAWPETIPDPEKEGEVIEPIIDEALLTPLTLHESDKTSDYKDKDELNIKLQVLETDLPIIDVGSFPALRMVRDTDNDGNIITPGVELKNVQNSVVYLEPEKGLNRKVIVKNVDGLVIVRSIENISLVIPEEKVSDMRTVEKMANMAIGNGIRVEDSTCENCEVVSDDKGHVIAYGLKNIRIVQEGDTLTVESLEQPVIEPVQQKADVHSAGTVADTIPLLPGITLKPEPNTPLLNSRSKSVSFLNSIGLEDDDNSAVMVEVHPDDGALSAGALLPLLIDKWGMDLQFLTVTSDFNGVTDGYIENHYAQHVRDMERAKRDVRSHETDAYKEKHLSLPKAAAASFDIELPVEMTSRVVEGRNPTSELPAHDAYEELVKQIDQYVQYYIKRPIWILPYPFQSDHHIHHEIVAVLILEKLKEYRYKGKIIFYESDESTDSTNFDNENEPEANLLYGFGDTEMDQKLEGIRIYDSQIQRKVEEKKQSDTVVNYDERIKKRNRDYAETEFEKERLSGAPQYKFVERYIIGELIFDDENMDSSFESDEPSHLYSGVAFVGLLDGGLFSIWGILFGGAIVGSLMLLSGGWRTVWSYMESKWKELKWALSLARLIRETEQLRSSAIDIAASNRDIAQQIISNISSKPQFLGISDIDGLKPQVESILTDSRTSSRLRKWFYFFTGLMEEQNGSLKTYAKLDQALQSNAKRKRQAIHYIDIGLNSSPDELKSRYEEIGQLMQASKARIIVGIHGSPVNQEKIRLGVLQLSSKNRVQITPVLISDENRHRSDGLVNLNSVFAEAYQNNPQWTLVRDVLLGQRAAQVQAVMEDPSIYTVKGYLANLLIQIFKQGDRWMAFPPGSLKTLDWTIRFVKIMA